MPDGLDFTAYYAAEVTRLSDNVKLFTCPIIPEKVSKDVVHDLPTLVPRNSTLNIPGRGTARWYTSLGVVLSSQEYNDSVIMTPASNGSYLLQLVDAETRSAKAYHIVVW